MQEKKIILESVPQSPDTSSHHLFYLHGLIVEMAGIRPKSEEHGYYEYELILEELAKEGFVVISEVRKKNTPIKPYAEKIAGQINTLLSEVQLQMYAHSSRRMRWNRSILPLV